MSEGSGVKKVVRGLIRLTAHLRRALHAVRRVGPGRYPGSITSVALDAGGNLRIEGFAQVLGEVVESVVVSVNDVVVGAAALDVATPDVAVARPGEDDAARSGWSLVVPRTAVPAGTVELGAVALTRSGLTESLERVTWTLPTTPLHVVDRHAAVTGHIDAPHTSSHGDGAIVVVTGWVAPARAIDRVEVFVDDTPVGAARLFCTPRPDVVDHLADPTAALAGFWHLAEVSAPAGATVRVRVQAVGPKGRVAIGHRDGVIAAPVPALDDTDRAWVAALGARAAMTAATWVPGDGVNLFVVAHDLGLGGAQLWLQEILRRILPESDVSCTVIAPADGPLRRELEAMGAQVHVVGRFPSQAGAYESMVRELTQIAADGVANVALINSIGSFVGVDVAARAGIPSVLAVHEHYSLNAFLYFAFWNDDADAHVRARARTALEHADALSFVADATKELYERDLDLTRPGRSLRISHGIRRAQFLARSRNQDRDRLRAAHGFAPDDFVLLSVGSVEARKSQSSLVLALDRLAASDSDAQAVILGMQATPYAGALRHLVDGVGLTRRVRLVDASLDVVPWYSMADAFVLASDAESLPTVLIEAMTAELPVVATDVGGVAEVVRDGETGIVCRPRDVGALADGLHRLLSMPRADRDAMTRRAATLIDADRDVEAYTTKFATLLRALAKDPSVSPEAVLAG